MKTAIVLGCGVLLALTAQAQEQEQSRTLPPQGYDFDHPEVLADQRLWGIAHGARLLALACASNGRGQAAEAWVDWREREAEAIRNLRAKLGEYYFQNAGAPPEAISAALGLAGSLSLAPDALALACDTLAEALGQPRYDLARRREEMLKK